MSQWTHSICNDCWKEKEPNRIPHRLIEAGVSNRNEVCCFCGNLTQSGIYVREDPKKLQCKGEHK